MTFDHPLLLATVPVIALVILALALFARSTRRRAAAAWSVTLGEQAKALGKRSPWFLTGAAFIAALGLAGPRWGSQSHDLESRARNIAIVMDVSRSMLARDVAPNRLGRATSLARRLLDDLQGDRLALIGFAGRGFLLSPLTLDATAIEVQLDALDPEMASQGGSGLANALEMARSVLAATTEGGDRAIVVFTDGESFEGDATLRSAGAALARSRITLIAVPVGDVLGARIPDPDGSWHKDSTGRDVVTVRRDDLLHIVADAAHGVVVSPAAPDPVSDVRHALDRLNRAAVTDHPVASLLPRAWIFALIAVLVLMAQTLTRRTAALVGLLLAVGLTHASAQRPARGFGLLARGDTAQARAAFLQDARRSGSDTAWFNAGTAALMSGDVAAAVDGLQRASTSLDPELRRRALYNLGTAYLLQARRTPVPNDTLLTAAATQLKEALTLGPNDANAKYNYELARGLRRPSPKPSSGSTGRGNGPQPPPPPGGGRGAMTPAEAEQVLSAMERAESATRRAQNQRQNRGEQRGPDW
ncbi:MAG TPA: VWA domain-containing protein [Gemmatimonadales bacterium]|nr:VWA domain-containing protein [Gemmatimonadales bacterium]